MPHNLEFNTHPQVFIDGVLIPLNKTPMYLGIKLDTKFSWKDQAANLKTKANPRISILRALGGSTWVSDKETMLLTYNYMVKPVFSYGPTIWMPNISKTNLDKIQVTQNRGLRIVTGCHQATSIDHLHAKYEILPVRL
jgi:hypothetical protein